MPRPIAVLTQSGLNFSAVMGSSAQSMRYSADLSPTMALILYTGLERLLWLPCVVPTVSSWDFHRSANNLARLDRFFSVPESGLFLRFRELIMQLTWLMARIYGRHLCGLYISIGYFQWQSKQPYACIHSHRSFHDIREDERKWMRCFDESG